MTGRYILGNLAIADRTFNRQEVAVALVGNIPCFRLLELDHRFAMIASCGMFPFFRRSTSTKDFHGLNSRCSCFFLALLDDAVDEA